MRKAEGTAAREPQTEVALRGDEGQRETRGNEERMEEENNLEVIVSAEATSTASKLLI